MIVMGQTSNFLETKNFERLSSRFDPATLAQVFCITRPPGSYDLVQVYKDAKNCL